MPLKFSITLILVVELFEFALVLLASSVMTLGSAYAYSSYSILVSTAEERSNFSSIASAAAAAKAYGQSSVSLSFDNVTITCHGVQLNYSSPHFVSSLNTGAECNFEYSGLVGLQTLIFSDTGGTFRLQVK